MLFKTVAFVILLVMSGYVVELCFHGMNLKDDFWYISGIVGLLLWFGIVVPVVARLIWKRKGGDDYVGETRKVPPDSTDATVADSVDDRMYNKDRSGNGGDRGGSVG